MELNGKDSHLFPRTGRKSPRCPYWDGASVTLGGELASVAGQKTGAYCSEEAAKVKVSTWHSCVPCL